MKYAITFTTIAAIHILIPLVLRLVHFNSSSNKSTTNIIKYPYFFLIVGIGGGIVVCGAFLLAMWQGFDNSSAAKIFCYTTVIILYPMSIWLSMQALNWKIIIDEEALIFTNFLRITRKYRYSNFTHIYVCHNRNAKIEKYILFVGKKRITVEGIVENFDNFEKLLKKRLKKEKLQPKFEIKYSRF